MYQLMSMVGSVPTGDERSVGMWIVIGALALVLVIVCAIMSVMSKKK